MSPAEEAGDEAFARARRLEHLRHRVCKLLERGSLKQCRADEEYRPQGMPGGGQVGALSGLRDPRREGSLNDSRPRQESGDDGTLTDADDEFGATRANAADDRGDCGQRIAAEALTVLDGVSPTLWRREPSLAAKALVNRGRGDFQREVEKRDPIRQLLAKEGEVTAATRLTASAAQDEHPDDATLAESRDRESIADGDCAAGRNGHRTIGQGMRA